MKTVDYSDCKTVFSLQSSKDAASEGPVEPTKPRASFRCWRGQVPADCGAPPSLPLGQAPLHPPSMSWAPSETASRRCGEQGRKLCLRSSAAGRAPTCPRLRRGHRGRSPRGGTGSPEPRRRPCRKPPVCLGPAPGASLGFFLFQQGRRGGGGRSWQAGKSGIFPRNVKRGEETHPSAPLCPFGTCWREKRCRGGGGSRGCPPPRPAGGAHGGRRRGGGAGASSAAGAPGAFGTLLRP